MENTAELQESLIELECELELSNARFNNLVAKNLDGMLVLNSAEEVVYLNPAAEYLFGCNIGQLLGEKIGIPAKEKHISEFKILNEKLGAIIVEILVTGVEWNGEKAYLASLRDITRRKEIEKKLSAQSEELKRSNADLEQFAYVASHDLNEPLRTISSFVELLAKRCKGKLDSDGNDYIEFIVSGTARMHDLIEDLLAYSRVGSQCKEFELVDCNHIFEHVINNLQSVIKETNTTITCSSLPTVNGDSLQIHQLLQNLISNAIKFCKDVKPEVKIDAVEKAGGWLFSVSDNGMGIEPQFYERIFVIFQRLHSMADYPGTGIGLAICKRVIDGHGGEIWLESEIGKGSTFHFTIPTAE